MRFLLAAFCVLLASAVIRLGWTEVSARADSSAALGRAAGIEDGWNAARLEDLAQLAGSNSARARELLRQATTVNPRQVSAWLALGLRAESAGDLAEAESALKQAARLDRQFLPAWTLTNFYFRRANREAFWLWARRAANMTYDDFRPLFRLCDVFEPDATAVMDRLGGEKKPGGDRKMLRAYVTYLAGEGRRLDAAEQAAWRLMAFDDQRDRPVFVNLITREINANRVAPALALWNAGVVPALPLDTKIGPVLTNGDFESKPAGEGFDWSMPSCPGLVSEWQTARLAFNLSGSQPDDCILLDQPIPLASRRRYRLRFESSLQTASTGAAYSDALRWEVAGRAVATLAPVDFRQSSEGLFPTTSDTLVRLRLMCRRLPGTVAFEGRIEIRRVRIEVE
jgi:tetratricopeptide (TPR) repeat protein